MKHEMAGVVVVLALLSSVSCSKHEEQNADATSGGLSLPASETTLTSPAGASSADSVSALAPADQEFVTKAAKTGMAEVQLATNVAARANSDDVKAFARKMIEDHNATNQELTMLAATKRLDPPADIDPEKKALDEELAKLSGSALDRRYMETMVKDHAAAVADFEKASQQVTDPDLKAWAAKTLPALHEHHRMAEEIFAKLPR